MLAVAIGALCLAWYVGVAIVCSVGYYQIYRYYRKRPLRGISETLPWDEIPVVTIIRPVKGLEPCLYQCLAATFRQTYPASKVSVRFCVSSRDDASMPTLERLVREFPTFDAQILVEEEDEALRVGGSRPLGPNPKIRNMSRAYRDAKSDIVWIVDCNIWLGPGVMGRMVDKLCGFSQHGPCMRNKFVHQLPLVVDIIEDQAGGLEQTSPGSDNDNEHRFVGSTSTAAVHTLKSPSLDREGLLGTAAASGGGRLEEMFFASSHAKFYTAINTVLIAPCIVGKSNMFRRSHLDSLTSQGDASRPPGIDYFSFNICEDHLIGDLLWKQQVTEERQASHELLGKHAMLYGDLAIQPMAGMSVSEYVARRSRWLRVRKFTVTLATLVEPGTECFLCSLYGAFAVTTLPVFKNWLGILPTWGAFVGFWFFSVIVWAMVDWTLYQLLHSLRSVEVDEGSPAFVRRLASGNKRTFSEWLLAWIGRETLALPIWIWAIYCGTTVSWRGRRFRVGIDMKVHAIDGPKTVADIHSGTAYRSGKARRE